MRFSDYCMDKIIFILLNIIGMLCISEYLSMAGNTASTIILIDILWFIILCSCITVCWYRRNKYFLELNNRVNVLEQPWLVSEVMPVSFSLEDKEYQKVIHNIGAAVIGEIHRIEDGQKEYEEYIENWIHEVKTPITFLYLLINNNINDEFIKKEIVMELKRIENDVESALYYARLGTAYKDYLVQKVKLNAVITDVISSNRILLMNNKIQVGFICDKDIVIYSDCKWIKFMLNQVLVNSVKYSPKKNARINIKIIEKDTTVQLSIEDNGIGICKEDLPRIFEKGFTGRNGHIVSKSTGIGLYLVKKMAEKLDIEVIADSVENKYTIIIFCFKKKIFFKETFQNCKV